MEHTKRDRKALPERIVIIAPARRELQSCEWFELCITTTANAGYEPT